MVRTRWAACWAAAALAAVCGCQSSPWSASNTAANNTAASNTAEVPPAVTSTSSPAAVTGSGPVDTSGPGDLQQVMAELDRLGSTDPAAQAGLLGELRQADPSLWPLVLQSFHSRLAYAGRLQQQEMTASQGGPDGPWAHQPGPRVPPPVPEQSGPEQSGPEHRMARLPAPVDAAVAPTDPPRIDYPDAEPATEDSDRRIDQPPRGRLATARGEGAARSGDVVPASYDPRGPRSWQEDLAAVIAALESRLREEPGSEAEIAEHARLRLLCLVANRRNDALRPIPAVDDSTADFWSKELYGLDVLLDAQRVPRIARRAAEARHHLGDALVSLGESAALEVRGLAFCKEVQSYGSVKRFDKYEFTPGQQLLLYAEIENFTSEETPKGFHTLLKSSYQIFDAGGRRVSEQAPTTIEEYCENPRRDYFIGCGFQLPERIYPGRHTLKLTIEDVNGQKIGESSIDFTIK